ESQELCPSRSRRHGRVGRGRRIARGRCRRAEGFVEAGRRRGGGGTSARLDGGRHAGGDGRRHARQDARAPRGGRRQVAGQEHHVDGARRRARHQRVLGDGHVDHGRSLRPDRARRRGPRHGAVQRRGHQRVRQRLEDVRLDVDRQHGHRHHAGRGRAVGRRQDDHLDVRVPLPGHAEAGRHAAGREGHRPGQADDGHVRHRAEERQGIQDDVDRAHEAVL
ncbi:MAG: hypothetical protein AVDCRST_MAG64-2484, partial [uncultured Phycisphaerae bacterium]